MNRVLLVCGSLQRSSANRAALDATRAALSASGVEVSAFEDLGAIPPLNPDRSDDPGVAVLTFRSEVGAADAVVLAAPESTSQSDGSRRMTNPKTLADIGALVSSLLASVAQSPSERFATITRLARDAAVELGPLADHISSQEATWFRERGVGAS